MKRALISLASLASLLPGSAMAAGMSLAEVPTAWRLENYMGNNVVAWYTSATCSNGSQLHFGSDAMTDDKNRFWSIVMTAKVSSRKVFVYYESTNCNIVSFGFPEGM